MNSVRKKIYSLSPEEVIAGYKSGVFPMGDSENTVNWYEADPRGIILLPPDAESLHITHSLKQVLKKNLFEIRINTAFDEVIYNCSLRQEKWINKIIIDVYTKLNKLGYAYSVEAWRDGKLTGGLYGVAINGAFFGESMFHKESNASKVCVVKLYDILINNYFSLFDIQMITPVFKTFGAVHISKEEYLKRLDVAMRMVKVPNYLSR